MKIFRFPALGLLCFMLISATFSGIPLEIRSLLNEKVELKIPKDFEIMDEDMVKLKYPSKRRPTTIYTNRSGGINVALNLTANKASQDLMASYKDMFVSSFKIRYPNAEWKESGVKEINGRQVGFLEVITPAVDTKIYNLMFFTDLEGQLLLCTFNCTDKDRKDWEPIAQEILQSLKIK